MALSVLNSPDLYTGNVISMVQTVKAEILGQHSMISMFVRKQNQFCKLLSHLIAYTIVTQGRTRESGKWGNKCGPCKQWCISNLQHHLTAG